MPELYSVTTIIKPKKKKKRIPFWSFLTLKSFIIVFSSLNVQSVLILYNLQIYTSKPGHIQHWRHPVGSPVWLSCCFVLFVRDGRHCGFILSTMGTMMPICLYYAVGIPELVLSHNCQNQLVRCFKLHVSYISLFWFQMRFCMISIEKKINSFLKQLPNHAEDKKLHFLHKMSVFHLS